MAQSGASDQIAIVDPSKGDVAASGGFDREIKSSIVYSHVIRGALLLAGESF